jgi:hypothetical protein
MGAPLENPMLDYSIRQPDGILVMKPHGPLTKEDFGGLSSTVNAYLASHARLRGVMIQSKAFPGWENFGGFTAHMHFAREHHSQVERVAIVTDSHFAGIAEMLGKHFIAAQVKHFPFADEGRALDWLETA